MRIAMIIAPEGFQDTEFKVPYEYFLSKSAEVDVYSTRKCIALGKLGMEFRVENDLSELEVKTYNAIVYIGGPGTLILRSNKKSGEIAKEAFDLGKVIGAICWSPTILAKAGLLKGKNATVWIGNDNEFGMQTSEYLESQGAKFINSPCVADGKIITANGPLAAREYAEKIWEILNL